MKKWSDRSGIGSQMAGVACCVGGLLCDPAWNAVFAAVIPGARIVGKVTVPDSPLVQEWDLSRMVVFLVPEKGDLPPAPPGNPWFVSQKSAQFRPPFLAVVKGQTVDFTNDDNIDHNVFSFSEPKKFDLGIYPKGHPKAVTFDREGPVLIFCSVHAAMNGIIFVVPNRLFALADSAGKFDIPGVPTGRYKVRTWHPDLPQGTQFVEVRPGDAASGNIVRLEIDLGRNAVLKEKSP